jgi:parallel beta-helix repeat protein
LKVKKPILRGAQSGCTWLTAANVQLRCLAAALFAVAWVIGAAVPADAAACVPLIASCCTISAPGTYTQTANITAPSGADCIDITASGVFFDTDGFTITGAGPLTGVGINIAATAKQTVIDMGGSTIHFFDTGVQNSAPLVQVDGDGGFVGSNHVGVANTSANNVVLRGILADFNSQQGFLITGSQAVRIHESLAIFNTADGIDLNSTSGSFIVDTSASNNGKSGIVLTRSNSNVVDDVTVSGNLIDGLWLKASSRNSVDATAASSNSFAAGFYIGCSLTGVPAGVTCSSFGLPASNGNSIVDGGAFSNSVGIGIDLGNKTNDIVDNSAVGNSAFDLKDGNVGCGTNSWVANALFVSAAPTTGCINASSGGFAE